MRATRSVLSSFRLENLTTRLYWADSQWVILDDANGQPWLYARQPEATPPDLHKAKYVLRRCGMTVHRYGWEQKDNTWALLLRRLRDDGH